MLRLILIAAAAAGCVLTSRTAFAEGSDQGRAVMQTVVTYSDLDLHRTAGAEAMLQRLRHAANIVCGRRPDARQIAAYDRYRSCVRTAMSGAVAQIDAPLVTARFYGAEPSATLALK